MPSAFRALVQIGPGCNLGATVIAVPDRDPVPPPDLTADTPVVHVFHPAQIVLCKAFRNKFGPSVFYTVRGSFQQRLHLYEPLGGDQGFDRFTAALAMAYRMGAVFNFYQKAQRVQVFDNVFAAFIPLLPFIRSGFLCHPAVFVNDNDSFQTLPQAHFIVVRVMGRGNLNGAGTELRIYIIIRNDGNLPVHDGQQDLFPYQFPVPFILRVHCYRRIAGNGLRTGSGNSQIFPFMSDDRIIDIPQMSRVILMLYFDIA